MRYPAEWRTDEAEQDGIWYRYFLAPPTAPENKTALSVTLLAGPLTGPVEDYAESYLAGNDDATSREEERQGARGRSWRFASPDGKTRHRLLLVALGERFWGLYAQGEAAAFEGHADALDEIWTSFTLERPELYPVQRWEKFGVALGVPESWRETREFTGRGTLLVQFTSPALAVQQGQTIHASLTLTVEEVPEGADVEAFYQAMRTRLGDNIRILNHDEWPGHGLVDVMRTETSVAVSYIKRFFQVDGTRGISLAFESRDDVFWRIEPWADLIASTLQVDATADAGAVNACWPGWAEASPSSWEAPEPCDSRWDPRDRPGRSASPRTGTASGGSSPSRAAPAWPPSTSPTTSTSPCPRRFADGPASGLFVEVEYLGAGAAEFRLQYASTAESEPWEGLYKPAEQRLIPDGQGLRRVRRALFPLPDFDPSRTQNLDASFRLEFRSDLVVSRAERPPRPARGRRVLHRGGAPARAQEDAGALLPHQLPVRRDHQRLQLQVHLVPGRGHGPPAGVHEEGEGLPDPRRGGGEALVARPPLPGQAPPDGRADAPPGPGGDRRAGREPGRSTSS